MTAGTNVAALAAHQEGQAEPNPDPVVPVSLPWPQLENEARHGLVGRFLEMIEPHTEADSVGILLQFLVMVGNLIGRGPHFRVEADEHYLNLFAVMVGASSKGRKGVSAGQAKRLLHSIDGDWFDRRMVHGLSSGEGLIWAVHDSIEKMQPLRKKGQVTGYEKVIVDEGEDDKRLLVLEAEFATALRVLKRDGSTLSATIRTAWDKGDLRSLTKNSPAVATGAHISIIGHITKAEVLRYLETTEAANGFGNRFLWCCVKRSKVLPEGGAAHTLDFGPLIRDLTASVEFARKVREIRRDDKATKIWATVYPELSAGKPGLLGAMVARGEAQTMRLACLYALLDRSKVVRAEHLCAALALWNYCEESARWVFADTLGDPVADEILQRLRTSSDGLTRTDIRDMFGRHRSQATARALGLLLEQELVVMEKEPTDGRPTERWRARIPGHTRQPEKDLLSHKSLLSQPTSSSDGQLESRSRCDKSDKSDRSRTEAPGTSCDKSDIGDKKPHVAAEPSWEPKA